MVSSQLLQVVTDVKTILTLGVREGSRLSWAHAGSIPVTVREVRRRNNSRIYCLIKRGLGNHYRATVVTMSAPDTFQKQRKIRARSQLLTEADSILANTVVYRVRKKAAARQSCSAPSPDYCSPEDIEHAGKASSPGDEGIVIESDSMETLDMFRHIDAQQAACRQLSVRSHTAVAGVNTDSTKTRIRRSRSDIPLPPIPYNDESSVQTSRLVASSSTSIDLLINQFALEIETNPSMAPSPMMMFNFAMRLGFRADGVARVMKDSNPFPVKILHFLTEWRSTNSHTDEVVLKRLLLEHIQGARMAHILDLMPEGMFNTVRKRTRLESKHYCVSDVLGPMLNNETASKPWK